MPDDKKPVSFLWIAAGFLVSISVLGWSYHDRSSQYFAAGFFVLISLGLSWAGIFGPLSDLKATASGEEGVARSCAFTAVMLISAGVAVLVVSTSYWGVAMLWAGASLFFGGIFGFLFGLPMSDTNGVASASAAANTVASAPKSRTLMAETASTLSKFVAGAAAVKAGDIYSAYQTGVGSLAKTFGGEALAGGIILYFLALGFLCGLVLPPYFLEKLRVQQGDVRQS